MEDGGPVDGGIRIIPCDNVAVADEGGSLLDVQGFAHSSFGVDIDQNDLGGRTSCQKCKSGGCANSAGSDDCDFLFHGYAPL